MGLGRAVVPPTYTTSVLALNPLAYWPAAESNGIFLVNEQSAGVAREGFYSQVALNGTTAASGGAAGQWTPASNSVANVLSTSLIAAFNPSEITVSLWFKVRAAGVWSDAATRPLIILQANAGNIIRIRKTNTVNQIDMQWFANSVLTSITYASAAPTGWVHVALTASKSNNRARLYINGAQQGADATMGGTWNGGNLTLAAIGANTALGASAWDGYITDAAIFASELTAAQIVILATVVPGRSSRASGQIAVNAASPLTTATYDGSGQATHPDVYDFGSGNTWNGFRYWMAMTPYPAADSTKENPSILQSADGNTWAVPAGLTNPLEPQPGAGFNSDVELLYDSGTSTMRCLWRESVGANDTYDSRESTDGFTWSNKTQLLQAVVQSLASTAFVKIGATWHAWSCDTTVSPIRLKHRTASALTGAWSAAATCTITGLPTSKEVWHVDVAYDTTLGQYHALLCVRDTIVNSAGAGNRSLFFLTSSDGDTWAAQSLILDPLSNAWDGLHIYRSCMVRTASGYDVWYGGVSTANAWRIGRTSFTL